MRAKNHAQGTDLHDQLQEIADGIEQLRRLLIFALLRNGASQEQVANALGMTQGPISKLLSKSKKRASRPR